MNITVIIIEILIMFLIFGFLVFGLLYISPLTFISDYPPEIQEVYYRTQNKEATREKMTAIMKVKWFHVKVCLPMFPVFAVMGVLCALIMIWIW